MKRLNSLSSFFAPNSLPFKFHSFFFQSNVLRNLQSILISLYMHSDRIRFHMVVAINSISE